MRDTFYSFAQFFNYPFFNRFPYSKVKRIMEQREAKRLEMSKKKNK